MKLLFFSENRVSSISKLHRKNNASLFLSLSNIFRSTKIFTSLTNVEKSNHFYMFNSYLILYNIMKCTYIFIYKNLVFLVICSHRLPHCQIRDIKK